MDFLMYFEVFDIVVMEFLDVCTCRKCVGFARHCTCVLKTYRALSLVDAIREREQESVDANKSVNCQILLL